MSPHTSVHCAGRRRIRVLPGLAVVALSLALALVPAATAGAETVTPPADAASGPSLNDRIYQVACPGAGDCIGVGAYSDSAGHNQALIDNESGGAWSTSNVPDNSLPGVLGTLLPPPMPYLTSVACWSVGNCVAADAYDDANGNEQGLIDAEANGAWTPLEAPLAGLSLNPNPGVEVADVTCPAAGACIGLGTYDGLDTYEHELIETQTASGWRASQAPLPAGAVDSSDPNPYDVACANAGNCAAVGYYTDGAGNQQGLLDSDNGGSWTATAVDLSQLGPAANPDAFVYAVSCPVAGACTAVGTFQAAAGSIEPFQVSEIGGTWHAATALSLPGNASTSAVGTNPPQSDLFLNDISCSSSGNCTVVGSYDATPANDVEVLTLTQTGGSWGAATELGLPSANPAAPNPEAALYSITCQSAGNCVAAGTYAAGSGDSVALVARQSSGSWSSAGSDLSTAYDAKLSSLYWASVDCSPGSYCAAGGYTANSTTAHENAFMLDAPGPPASPKATVSGDVVTLSWTPPSDTGGLPLSGYTITANDLTDPPAGGQTVTAAGSATSTTLTGLSASDTYNFTLSAQSLLGQGLALTSGSFSPATAPTTPSSPSRQQILASLRKLLDPRGTASRLKRLRHTHRYRFRYKSLERGRVTVRWYHVVTIHHHRRRIVVGSGSAKPSSAKTVSLTVRLRKAGRRLFVKSHRRLRLTAVADFRGGGLTVTRSGRFTLH
jgi:hypothetical protein